MHVPVLGFLFLLVALDAVPALVLVGRIVRRARAAGVPAGWHVGFALFGGVIAGMLVNVLAVQFFLYQAQAMRPVPAFRQIVLVIVGGVGGSAAAATAVYLHLRMATQRDPDYEEPFTRR